MSEDEAALLWTFKVTDLSASHVTFDAFGECNPICSIFKTNVKVIGNEKRSSFYKKFWLSARKRLLRLIIMANFTKNSYEPMTATSTETIDRIENDLLFVQAHGCL